ncbi:MAG: hypothetical protein RMK02_01500 [Burkholderiales bacterium]|nr:hypothetical protein [Burkholderiales bacterium]
MKSLANGCKLGALGAAGRLSVLLVTLAASVSVHAAQVVNPIHVSGGNRAPGDNLSTGSITVGAGTSFTFDVRYEVTSPQTANEAGLGLKLRYDASKFENVNVTPVNAAGGDFTDVTQVLTKCIVAAPSDQVGTYSIGGFTTPREVIFGWLDTSIRTGGAVGWPGSPDPAAPNGCLNPGFTTATGGTTPPSKLFRVTLKTKPGFTSGSTTVRLTADGNVSFANASPGMADKDITVHGSATPPLGLASTNPYVSRKTHGTAGTFDLPLDPNGAATGSTITVEPRQTVNGSHTIVINFNAPVSSSEFPASNISATQVAGGSGSLPTSVSYSGNSLIITVGNSSTPVPDRRRIQVIASGAGAAVGLNPSIVFGTYLGDVDGSREPTGTDVNLTKAAAASGTVNATTFRRDVNLDGNVTGTDVNIVKARAAASGGPL